MHTTTERTMQTTLNKWCKQQLLRDANNNSKYDAKNTEQMMQTTTSAWCKQERYVYDSNKTLILINVCMPSASDGGSLCPPESWVDFLLFHPRCPNTAPGCVSYVYPVTEVGLGSISSRGKPYISGVARKPFNWSLRGWTLINKHTQRFLQFLVRVSLCERANTSHLKGCLNLKDYLNTFSSNGYISE